MAHEMKNLMLTVIYIYIRNMYLVSQGLTFQSNLHVWPACWAGLLLLFLEIAL